MKNYYKVTAKCGHVGRDCYYEGMFYEVAESASHAAQIVRGRGRVKHHHKDAILSVERITLEEYEAGIIEKEKEEYFRCTNSFEQYLAWDEIKEHIRPETYRARANYGGKKNKNCENKPRYDGKRKIKKPAKYAKYYAE